MASSCRRSSPTIARRCRCTAIFSRAPATTSTCAMRSTIALSVARSPRRGRSRLISLRTTGTTASRPRCWLKVAYKADFWLEMLSKLFEHRLLGDDDQFTHVARRGVAQVDHDVRVDVRDLGIAVAVAF